MIEFIKTCFTTPYYEMTAVKALVVWGVLMFPLVVFWVFYTFRNQYIRDRRNARNHASQ